MYQPDNCLLVQIILLPSQSPAKVMLDGQLSNHTVAGTLPVLSLHLFAIYGQLLFLNHQKRNNGRRNIYMTISSQKSAE